MDMWAVPEVMEALRRHLGCATDREVYRVLDIDRPVRPEPAWRGPALPPGTDCYGIRRRRVRQRAGSYLECANHPLAGMETVAQVEAAYTWPKADWFDFSLLPGQLTGLEEYPVEGGGSEPFLTYKELRGEEQAYLDLIERPELVEHCLGRLFDFRYEYTRRILESLPGRVTYCYVAEDLGSQEGLLYSPRHIRRFFLPGMQRMADLAHQAGAYVFCHTDGAVRRILPDLIGIGIDILNPIQWRCPGMDRAELKRDFGDRLVFHGGVDNQQTLAFGTPEEVTRELAQNLATLGAGGGHIPAPCHNLQAGTPLPNILALYDRGRTTATP